MKTNHHLARIFGIFFLAAFLAYGLGSGLTASLLSSSDALSSVHTGKVQLICGVILIALIHTFVNVGLASIMLPIVKPYNSTIAYGYFGAVLTATLLLTIGGIFLLLLAPLSDEYVKAGSINTPYFQTLTMFCKQGNFFAYQLGMAIWGLGGMALCSLLFRSKLIPKLLAAWGFVGYVIFIAGTVAELFGYTVGVLFSIPGGLFEVVLSLWLIIKGFNAANEISPQ